MMTMRSTFNISFVTYKNSMLLICHVLTVIYEITMPGTKSGKVSKLVTDDDQLDSCRTNVKSQDFDLTILRRVPSLENILTSQKIILDSS